MNKNSVIETIKREILGSSDLDPHTKLEAMVLLDEASRTIPLRENLEVIQVLKKLYGEVTGEEYKETLLQVIKKYQKEVRVLTYGCQEETVTLSDFLGSLGILTSDIPQEILDLKLVVGVDDGMGYTPNGFQDVIDSYPDKDDGVIRIWV